ncbi:MAG: metal ABC transporter permease [Desulfobacterota bacterium]|nr:metal ABC transporter permease [Thermodesulfobacteriota bacterium]
MSEFVAALREHSFLQYAVGAGLLCSVACGIVGSYVVTRRITYIAGSIAHCVLGGIGAARYVQVVHGWQHLTPFVGAIGASIVSAVIIGIVSLKARQREDTVIGALWAIGMAIGVMFIAATPGYNEDLMSYLFGNILMVSRQDLITVAFLDAVVIGISAMLYNEFLAICFDEEFAQVRGIQVAVYYLVLLCMTAITVVLLATMVGVLMVIALLTLPVAIAGVFARTLKAVMLLSVVLCSLFTTAGIGLSYTTDLPAGATIIVIAGAAYIATIAIRALLCRSVQR